jgi:hypothetical protein
MLKITIDQEHVNTSKLRVVTLDKNSIDVTIQAKSKLSPTKLIVSASNDPESGTNSC